MARRFCLLWLFPALATAVYGTEKANTKDASAGTAQGSSTTSAQATSTPMVIAVDATLSLRMPSSTYTFDRETRIRTIRRNVPRNAYSATTTAATPSVRYITRGDRSVRKHPLCFFTALPCPHKRRQRRNPSTR